MKSNLIRFLMIPALLLAISAAAKTKHYDLILSNPTEVSGVQLKGGNYEVAVEDGSLLFYQNRKEVARVPVRIEQLGTKNQNTSLTINTAQRPHKLLEIQLRGTTMKLVLEDGTASQLRGQL